VLVAEGNLELRAIRQRFLSGRSSDVHTAANGLYGVVGPCMVTMVITGYGASSLAEEARDAGVRHILLKPIDFPRLLALIEEALSCAFN
jgi:CheY-like chemotaxis protein